MTTLSKKENSGIHQISPATISLEDIVVTWILQRFKELPSESFKDIVELMEIFTNPETPEREQCDIYETLREILFPQLVGKVGTLNAAEQMPPKLQSRASYIGRKVKEYRESKGFTQIQLAEKSGLEQSQISRLEAGEHSPSHKTLEKIAKALEITIGTLDPAQ